MRAVRSGPGSLRERGAILVEMALIFPIFATLLLGVVSAALAYGQSSAIHNASREAARFGATQSVEGDLPLWLANVALVAEAAATGDLDVTADGHAVCVAYVYPDGATTHDRTHSLTVNKLGNIETYKPCFVDGRPITERRVQVLVTRPTTIQTGFWSQDVTLSANGVNIFERALP
ncbi:MAG: pilus assembly protein [Acidimicrobiales bacterium]|nr:pilus assembly protein [Acidimicrobiales bacterium]